MISDLPQDNFRGDYEVLTEFLKLAKSPIRSEERRQALARWKAYKTEKLEKIYIQRSGGPIMVKGWQNQLIAESAIDLRGANLNGIIVGFVDLRGVNLEGASLRGAWLKAAEMEHISLKNADLSPLLRDGYNYETRLLQADLTNANLQGAKLHSADLSDATLRYANLSGADLNGANLSRANLVQTNLEGTDLRGCRIYGISAWDIKLCQDAVKRQNLIITPENTSEVHVDDIEVAHFVYLLLNRSKLRNVINAVTQKGVLILGRFSDGGLATLKSIATTLREYGYLPMLFDFDKPEDRDYTETVQTLAGLSRFVVVDLSGPSVPQELMATVPNIEIPFVPILQNDLKPHSMFRDLQKYQWMQKLVFYNDVTSLCQVLQVQVIRPAEDYLQIKQQRMLEYRG